MSRLATEPETWNLPGSTRIEGSEAISATRLGDALIYFGLSTPYAYGHTTYSGSTPYAIRPVHGRDFGTPITAFRALRRETPVEITAIGPTVSVASSLTDEWLQSIHRYFIGFISRSTAVSPLGDLDFVVVAPRSRVLVPPRYKPRPTLKAIEATDDLLRWLDMTHDELAALVGVARGTLFNWRTGTRPRPGTIRKLLRIHALIDVVVRRLGEDGARVWVRAGQPSPLELLLRRELEEVEGIAYRDFFRQPDLRPSQFMGYTEDPEALAGEVPSSTSTVRPRRSGRTSIRRRLPRS